MTVVDIAIKKANDDADSNMEMMDKWIKRADFKAYERKEKDRKD